MWIHKGAFPVTRAFLGLSPFPKIFPRRFISKDPALAIFNPFILSCSKSEGASSLTDSSAPPRPHFEKPQPFPSPHTQVSNRSAGPLQDWANEGSSGVENSKRQIIQNSFPFGWGMFTL